MKKASVIPLNHAGAVPHRLPLLHALFLLGCAVGTVVLWKTAIDASQGRDNLIYGGILLAYSASFWIPAARRYYGAGGSWITHIGWSVAALGWALLFVVSIGTAEGFLPYQTGLFLVTAAYFLHGTRTGSPQHQGHSRMRTLHGLLCVGFLLVMVGEVPRLWSTIGADDSQRLVSGYSVASVSAILASFYGLVAWHPRGALSLFRGCPSCPAVLKTLARWVDARLSETYAWLNAAIVAWLLIIYLWLNEVAPKAMTVAVWLLPLYGVVLIPMLGIAWSLSRGKAGGSLLVTKERERLLDALHPLIWLWLFVTAVFWSNTYLWAYKSGAPIVRSLVNAVEGLVPATKSAPEMWTFALVAFLAMILHYILLIEIPFWHGQRVLKEARLRETSQSLAAAENALLRVTETSKPGADTTSSPEPVGKALATYVVAVEQARAAKEIPLHAIKSGTDLVKKALYFTASTSVSTLLGLNPNL